MTGALILAAGEGAVNSIDQNMVTQVINLTKSVMGLFSEFPLNVMLVASLSFIGFALFARAKRAAM